MADSDVGKWRDKKEIPVLVGLACGIALAGLTAVVLFGLAAPEDSRGNWLPMITGLQYAGAWLISINPFWKQGWQDALVVLNAHHMVGAVVGRAQASLVVGFLAAVSGYQAMLPFVDEFRVRLRLDRGRLLVRKRYPAARAAQSAFRPELDAKPRRANLYVSIAPGVLIGWNQEVRGFLAVGKPGSGKTVWFQYMLNQIIERSDHLARIAEKIIEGVPQEDLKRDKEKYLEPLPLHPDKIFLVDTKGDMTQDFPSDDFMLLAPHDTGERKEKDGTIRRIGYAWDIGRDIVGLPAAQDFAASLIPLGDKDPSWSLGARSILTTFIRGLQCTSEDDGRDWGWQELADLLNMSPQDQKAFLDRFDPKASALYTFEKSGGLTAHANSFVSIVTNNVGPMIDALASGWGHYDKKHRFSVTEWLLDPLPNKRFLIVQMSGQVQNVSEAWVRCIIGRIASFTKSPDLPNSDKRRIWMVCDEAPQYFAKDDGFLKTIEVGRSKGYCAIVAAQVGKQFIKVWSDAEWETLEAIIGMQLIFQTGGGQVTKKLAEDVVGTSDWTKTNRSRTHGKERGGSVSHEVVREQVVLANWFDDELGVIKKKGVLMAWIGGKHLCRLFVPFQANWKPKKKRRLATVGADWVKSNRQTPSNRPARAAQKGRRAGGGTNGPRRDQGQQGPAGNKRPDDPAGGMPYPAKPLTTPPRTGGLVSKDQAAAAADIFDMIAGGPESAV